MKLKIRYKLLIGFALVVLLSTLIQAFTFSLTRDYISSQINILLQDKAITAANQIDDFFQTIQSYNLSVARIYRQIQNVNDPSVITTMENITENDYYIDTITILALSGREQLKVEKQTKVTNDKLSYEIPTDQFLTAKEGRTAISKVYYTGANSGSDAGPHVDIFSPIFANKNTVIGVTKMQIELTKLWDIIARIKFGSYGYAYIVDNEGRLIAHPDQSYLAKRPILLSRKLIDAALHNKLNQLKPDDSIYINEKNTEVIGQAMKIIATDWIVIFEQPTSEAYSFLTYMRNLFIFTLIASLFLLLLVSLFLSESLTRPIRRLQEATKLIEQGTLGTNISLKSGDETESLANSFNKMMDKLLQREQLLKKERNEMEILLQSLSDGVIVVDKNNNIVLLNKAAERITELQMKHALGKHIDAVFPLQDDEVQIKFQDYRWQIDNLQPKLKLKGLQFIVNPEKKVILSLTVSPVFFEDSTQYGWIVTFHDITKLQELDDMKLDFVSMAAHELRTPLTAIRGYTSLLKDEYTEKLDDQGKMYMNRLLVSTKNLAGLIDNLLNVSRIERNTFKVELAPMDLVDIIKRTITNLTEQAQTRQQELLFTPPSEKLPPVLADKSRIEQVLTNLLANAISYTPEKGTIEVLIRQKGAFLETSVKDNGIGIPPEALPKLFTKFFRVTGILEQGSKGTGLGLFITKSIVELHKGEIHVESDQGKGSTFIFTLPLAEATQKVDKVDPAMPDETAGPGQDRSGIMYNKDLHKKRFETEGTNLSYTGQKNLNTVLLVEDDLYIRELYETALTKAGYHIETAVDGEDGLIKYRQKDYELLLLDIMMPKVTGIKVLKEVRESHTDNKNVPIFMLTNLGQESIIKESFALGADGYFMKSQLTPKELVVEISAFLNELRHRRKNP